MVLLPAALPAQERLQQLMVKALADLGDPRSVADACRQLEHAGPRVVPFVRERLHWSQQGATTPTQRRHLIYVLGRLGEVALPALPELRDILRDQDELLATTAAWTLGNLVPFVTDPATLDAIRQDLVAAPPATRRAAPAGRLVALLRLGPQPDTGRLLADFDRGDHLDAVCTWVTAHAAEPFAGRQELLVRMVLRLDAMMRPLPVQFDKGARADADDLATAVLALRGGDLDGDTARALLQHWHPDQRLRALLWLQDHGATMPAPLRGDLVVRLWDDDPGLARRAAQALARWGTAGLVGLLPLRLMAQAHADEGVRRSCAQAAERVLAATDELAAADAAFVLAIDAACCTGAPVVVAPASAKGLELAATALRYGEWNGATALRAVLATYEGGGECDDAVDAVYGWLTTRDAPTADVALAWLSRRGPAVRRSATRRAEEWARLAFAWVPEASRGAAIEATAWFELSGATPGEHDEALHADDQRRVARAIAKGLAAGDGWRPDLAQLRALATAADTPLQLRPRSVGPFRERPITTRFCLGPPLRALAALALASSGADLPSHAGLVDELRQRFAVEPASLAAWVAQQRRAGTFSAVLDDLEAECRRRLEVDPGLCWPTITTARDR